MLLLFPQGQLGNQIFQYQFAKSIVKKGEYIVTSHAPYFSIIDEDENKHFKFVPGIKIWKYINFGCMKVCEILSKIKIISVIKANRTICNGFSIEDKGYKIENGLFKNFKFIKGYFINDDVHLKQSLFISNDFVKKANLFLSQIPANNKKIFIHVRRGDYLTWSVMGEQDTSLPLNYYNKIIELFYSEEKKLAFIFLSDDIKRCKKHFGDIKNTYFSDNDVGTDFAIMTLCDGGGISASSLSFLGAYYCNGNSLKIGPKFFLGFKHGIWYPFGINSRKFKRITVKKD